MTNLSLYRRRIIPDECILLKDDIILSCDEEHIVTSWQTLRPKRISITAAPAIFSRRALKSASSANNPESCSSGIATS